MRALLGKNSVTTSMKHFFSTSSKTLQSNDKVKCFIETYGCQMNVSDSEIVRSVLAKEGYAFVDTVESAECILVNTCAIREGAEQKIWHRLDYFQSLKNKNKSCKIGTGFPMVGVLGCMAERLKTRLLEEKVVNFVCGPDAYRDIPRLIQSTSGSTGQKEANVQLSLEETYADISPVREASSTSAFISIMRGCNNMCSYCIVPFTRGRERSRVLTSIVDEVRLLADTGIREIVLLGQNVNSYHDSSELSLQTYPDTQYSTTQGFSNIYRSRSGPGARFGDLLDAVSSAAPETRIRFTSPHPKDFPDDVLSLVAERPNICASLHLPAQSGSTTVLERMRRGYSREAYLDLITRARSIIPGVGISTDMISGFCGETEEEHRDTVRLMKTVAYDQAFMFAYSMREKTHAAYHLEDDVPEAIKLRRLQEVIKMFYETLATESLKEINTFQLVLVEGPARRSDDISVPFMKGRSDSNRKCLFPSRINLSSKLHDSGASTCITSGGIHSSNDSVIELKAGDFVIIQVTEVRGQSLMGIPIEISSITEFHRRKISLMNSRATAA